MTPVAALGQLSERARRHRYVTFVLQLNERLSHNLQLDEVEHRLHRGAIVACVRDSSI